MLFNSLTFAIFFPTVFILYWFAAKNSVKKQNLILLFSSYLFYGWWDYRFLFLLMFSTFLDYFTGLRIFNARTQRSKKTWLLVSILINLGFLCFFKYYNFFIDSFATLLSYAGLKPNLWTLNIILPIGISFYTFHGLSYVLDIYNKNFKPTTDFVDYSVFVSFFPLLVAGPIERATHLLPQVQSPRRFDYASAVDGLRQILWGLLKKIVIADSCAEYTNLIFNNSDSYNGSTLVIGAVLFAFQIYGDFSGYSDIALGTARLLGFELLKNFAYPYFSRDIAEFWRRWHISLTSWFRDYVFFPLVMREKNKTARWVKVKITFIIFLLSGLWHGANWTFIAWGALNAIYFLPALLLKRPRSNFEIVAPGRLLPSIKEVVDIGLTFSMIVFAWILFRANNTYHAYSYISKIFSRSLFRKPEVFPKITFVLIGIFIVVEWLGREQHYAIAKLGERWPKAARWALYYALIILILSFTGKQQKFIYFQF